MQTDQTILVEPALTKARVPWSSLRRVRLSHEHRVLKKVIGLLNKLTPETFYLLERKLIYSGITTPDTLEAVVSLIHHKAVLEPIYCPMYAHLCSDLGYKLRQFPSNEPGGKQISFKRLLLNHCQEVFECADTPEQRLLKLGNIRLIGELWSQGELWSRRVIPERILHDIVLELLGPDKEKCPEEEMVTAICLLLKTIGKQLDENQNSKRLNDVYFGRLKDISVNPLLTARIRFMVLDVLDLRLNNWVPRREEVKPKTIAEIHREAERDMGLYPGATKSLRSGYY